MRLALGIAILEIVDAQIVMHPFAKGSEIVYVRQI